MARFVITETAEYVVEAESEEAAEALYLTHGPTLDSDQPIAIGDVSERLVQPL